MPFSHSRLKTTTGIQVFSQVNKYTLSYRFLYGNVQGCVLAKNRPVSFKGRSGVYKEKLTSVLAFSVLHSSCEDLQELLWPISNLIGLSNKL